ncbi:MAG: hypothetical protein WCO06_01490 [Candidatus Roizmanbacteria bacterium]
MINKITEKLIKQFRKTNLSLEDRVALTTVLLDKLQALPLESTFIIDSKGISVNGKVLEPEQVINFTESCAALKDNFARKVINEQIRYLSVNMGIHNSLSIDTLMFAKAALWCLSQEEELLSKIA